MPIHKAAHPARSAGHRPWMRSWSAAERAAYAPARATVQPEFPVPGRHVPATVRRRVADLLDRLSKNDAGAALQSELRAAAEPLGAPDGEGESGPVRRR